MRRLNPKVSSSFTISAKPTADRYVGVFGAFAHSRQGRISTTLAAGECARHERGVTGVRQQLGQAAMAAAWGAGQQLTDEAALAYALGEIGG